MEGDSVILNTIVSDIKEDDDIQWKYGAENSLIAEISKENRISSTYDDVPDGRFRDRLKLDDQTGSLTITHTTTEHTGVYKLEITGAKLISKTFSVSVYARLPVPVIISNSSQCSSSSSSSSSNCSLVCSSVVNVSDATLSWYAGMSVLSSISVCDLSISLSLPLEVEYQDKNTYSCVLNNPISNQTTHLDINTLCHTCAGFGGGRGDGEGLVTAGRGDPSRNDGEFLMAQTQSSPVSITQGGDEGRRSQDVAGLAVDGRRRQPVDPMVQTNIAGAGDPGDDSVTENRGDADVKEEPAAAEGVEGWRAAASGTRYNEWFISSSGVSAVEPDRVSVMEGDSVTLNTGVQTNQQDRIKWYFNDIRIAQINRDQSKICTDVQCKERFRDRLKLDHQTGSLTITHTRNTDAGEYQLKILSSGSEKIFNVTVTGDLGAEMDNKNMVEKGAALTSDTALFVYYEV
ncbi:uncharacterized protein LOC130087004 [Rhinichthys klamathensis goyatoka]|uniref:uncharacterized protein LOC130087004 n=1 Tax=Rhinichthys klamathensis goyatoka TaxID=3034132 RepID=UPI0024B49FBF|nr:uncharacterized protein LOC130087004 [Rhinichthys klamathensis goyatoka]